MSKPTREGYLYYAGYVLAHEMFYQLILKSDLAINKVSPVYSDFEDHYGPLEYPLNLNTKVGTPGLDDQIHRGPGNNAELMLDMHWNLLREYFHGK